MNRYVLTLAAAALLLVGGSFPVAPTPVLAQDSPSDPGYKMYEKEAKKILKAAGDKIWAAAEKAKRNGLFQFATEQAERTLKYNPNQKDAREYLGYVRKGKKWVVDEEAAGKVKRANQKSAETSKATFEKTIKKWKDTVLKKANQYLAARYAKLGDVCGKKGFPLQAIKGYEYALRLDKECKAARAGLGHKKLGKIWVTKRQLKAIKGAAKGEKFEHASSWDSLFGITMNKARSEHFEIESPFSQKIIMDLLEKVEIAYAYYLADLDMDPTEDVFGRRVRFCVMETEDQWNKYVDAYASDKEFTRKMGGTGDNQSLVFGMRNKEGTTIETKRDMLVFRTIHMLNHHVWRLRPAFLDEGLSYYYTVKVLNTSLTHTVARKKGNYAKPGDEGGIKDWNDPDNWKPNMKEIVRKKNDVPLRTLVLTPVTKLQFEATIKAWSVASWMMDKDRDQFIELLDQLRTNNKPVVVLEGLLGKGLEDIDAEWQQFVIRNY